MKDIVNSYLAYAAITLGNFVVGVLAARLLLPVGRGELGQVLLWPTLIAALGACAITDAIIFHLANRREAPAEVLGSAFAIGAMLGLVLSAIGVLATPWLYAGTSPTVRSAAYLYLLFIPLNGFGTYMVAAFQGRLHFGLWNLVRALPSCANGVYAVVIWLLFGASVTGFAVAALLANGTTVAAGAVLLTRHGLLRLRPRRALMAAMFGYGVRLHIGDVLNNANQRLDQILIVQWLAVAAYGHYLVALALANTAIGLVALLGHLIFPKVMAEVDRASQLLTLGRYLRLAIALSLPGSILLGVLAKFMVLLIFGASFAPAVPALQILAIGIVPSACKTLLVQATKGLGRPRMIVQAETVTLIVDAALLVLLLPRMGILGAAAAMVAAQATACVTLALILRAHLGFSLAKVFMPSREDLRVLAAQLRHLRG